MWTELRGSGQRVNAFSERRARDRCRVDRIGLPGLAHGPPRGLSQSGCDPDDRVAAGDQPALEAAGYVPAVLDSPHSHVIELAGEPQRVERPVVAAGIVSCPRAAPVTASSATSVCDRLCVSTSITIICTVPSLELWPTERISGGQASLGADATLLICVEIPPQPSRPYQVTPAILDGGGRHGKSRVRPKSRQANRESARRRPRDKPMSRTTPTAGPQALTEARSGCGTIVRAKTCTDECGSRPPRWPVPARRLRSRYSRVWSWSLSAADPRFAVTKRRRRARRGVWVHDICPR